MKTAQKHILIIQCTKHGVLDQVSLDSGNFLANVTLPIGIHNLVEKGSLSVFGDFWLSVQENFMTDSTRITLNIDERHIDFHFSGYLINDKLLLCGNTETNADQKALDEIMAITNEQANKIRIIEKKTFDILKTVENKKIPEIYLDDFTSLNNELINNKRELIRKNKNIELLNSELETANKNLTLLTYSLSHDLREPLRMINSFIELLYTKYSDVLDQKGQTYLNFSRDGAKRLSQMLEGLLEYHTSDHFATDEKVDLNQVLCDVKHILQMNIEEKKAEIANDPLPMVTGSVAGYTQILQNLISNALKFVPKDRVPKISLHIETHDKGYTLLITDNGIGMTEPQQREAFIMFKRLNPATEYEGTGMGLAMVKRTIERMGGTIRLSSQKDVGSTFFLDMVP